MRKRLLSAVLICILLAILPASAWAQNYSFTLEQQTINAYINDDGTVALDYVLVFSNDPGASPIDFVDVGFPNPYYNLGEVTAEVNGQPVRNIEDSPYVDYGVALDLGDRAIRPGETGQVHVYVPNVRNLFYTDETEENYAAMQISSTWFDSDFVHGDTDLSVTIHFPPGVQPAEPRWHAAPAGFPEEPDTGFDSQGRIVYTWRNPDARGDRGYVFGASLPQSYIPATVVQTPPQPGLLESLGIDPEAVIGFTVCGGILGFIFLITAIAVAADRRRKLQYLPPKVSIGGHGIKRGLTAVEAAVLLETPMDKVLTMILFGVLKKGAAEVEAREPLELNVLEPLPDSLRTYEKDFLEAFETKDKRKVRRELQDVMVNLVKSVATKMKGFSKRETVAYYRDIMERAWGEVEAADTPEVKSQKFDEYMEWTMLDREFDDRTQEVFRHGPVFVPVWWGRYDPGYGGRTATGPARTTTPTPSAGRGGTSLPTLPGSDFAVTMVSGIQNFSSNVVGNVTDFTSRITNRTNPPPPPSRSGGWSSGGGSSCACACAGCACACACAGGGR